jgi:hypothetical protein
VNASASPDALLTAIGKHCGGLDSAVPDTVDRNAANGRWLAAYTKGLTDTDTLSDFVYGELYVPLSVTGTTATFQRSWSFPSDMDAPVRSFALDFAKPFWAEFKVGKDVRTTQVVVKPGAAPETLSEHLMSTGEDSYRYEVALLDDVKQTGEFSLKTVGDRLILGWTCEVSATTPAKLVTRLAMLAEAGTVIGQKLAKEFAPG